jgi:hypothetical protein
MKINFRKISAIAASALMTGMTLGVAAAANYPAPFVSGGVASVAVVYGTGAGVSSLDMVQAGNIQDSLGTYVDANEVVVEGGESFVLDKTSNHFNLNQALNLPYPELDDADMDFLADGTFDDGDINTDYTQTITLSDKTLTFFADSEYNDEEPTLGFHWTNGQEILNYKLAFEDTIVLTDLNDTELPLMGNMYYVLTATDTLITLLDSAEKVVLAEGDSVTVGEKTVSVEYIESGAVKFNVDGEITDTLDPNEPYELDDGSYIIANDIMYASKETGISKVEFSIGAGKIAMDSAGGEIEVNEEPVDGLESTFDGDSIKVTWNSDDDSFLTEENALTMPIFESIRLVFGGMDFPDSPEAISLSAGEQMTLSMGNYELPLFWYNESDAEGGYLGEEDFNLVTLTRELTANYTDGSQNESVLVDGLDLAEDNRFLVTTVDADLEDIDTLYYEVTGISWDNNEVAVELTDLIGTNDLTFDDLADEQTVGDIDIKIIQVNDDKVYLNFSGTTMSFNKAVSEKGLEVTLPAEYAGGTVDVAGGYVLTFTEANADVEIGGGSTFTATVKNTSNDKLHVASDSIATLEYEADQEYGYVISDLATKVTTDLSGDENQWDLEYYGEEVTAQVMVVGGAATVSGGSNSLGNILVKDTEVSSVATKNLIVVGGSCINSAAAALVGGTKCGASWTEATGIGSGQFLIKGYADSTITTGLALLVAGYDAEDTVKATTYLTNKVVDTSKAYKGTTSTELAVVID